MPPAVTNLTESFAFREMGANHRQPHKTSIGLTPTSRQTYIGLTKAFADGRLHQPQYLGLGSQLLQNPLWRTG